MGEPKIRIVGDGADLARAGADLVAGVIASVPHASVIVATGNTPLGVYAELAERRAAGQLDTSGVTVVQLDEYLGLGHDDRRSLYGWMRRSFLDPLGIGEERVLALPLDGDLAARCAAFDRDLDARGGVDLAILGIGANGHLGFNEPPADAFTDTREVELSPGTIQANGSYWGTSADVPARAVTMGLRQVLGARTIVLLVSGAGKRAILHRALEGAVTPDVPASFLRATEADVTVIADGEAWGA